MIKIIYSTLLILIGFISLHAQKFEKEYISEVSFDKGGEVILHVNYADIEIKEWKKNKIKVKAVMQVEGKSKVEAQSHFDAWNINLFTSHGEATIRSTSTFRNKGLANLNFEHIDFSTLNFEMPEINIESLGVLDSLDFSFPNLDLKSLDNLALDNKLYIISGDSITNYTTNLLENIDYEKLKNDEKYLLEWQERNKGKIEEIVVRSKKLTNRLNENRIRKQAKLAKMHVKRIEKLTEKRNRVNEKRLKIQQKRNQNIKTIIKNRSKGKVRTIMTIYVPKGTVFNMNVKYSKVKTN